MKCIPKHTDYECIQWEGNNFKELSKFCGDNNTLTINFGDNILKLQSKYNPKLIQNIHLGDYIIKKNNIYFDVLDEEYFEAMYEILK